MAPLPNGNVLVVAWERKTAAEALAAGFPASVLGTAKSIWLDRVVEVQPTGLTTGKVVWEWHFWDHLVQDQDPTRSNYGSVAGNPQLLDLVSAADHHIHFDMTHVNSIDFSPKLDQIALGLMTTSEVVIIDHSTTTLEAKGHAGGKQGKGGDLLYRWGNPEAYDRQTAGQPRVLYHLHGVNWVPLGFPGAGDLLLFNNGVSLVTGSSLEEITPPVNATGGYLLQAGLAFGPKDSTWTYQPSGKDDISTAFGGSGSRLKNGNTLICDSMKSRIVEVTAKGKVVWQYINPVSSSGPQPQGKTPDFSHFLFKALRYEPLYAGLAGKVLTPKGPLELPAPGADAGP